MSGVKIRRDVNPDRARAAGRLGGTARAAKLTPERRSEIARLGGKSRWAKAKST